LQYNIKAITSKNPFFVEVIPETVGQFTGLTDRNDNKIFEGDILKTRKYGKISDNIIVNGFDTFAVIYKPCMFRLVNRNRRFNFVNIRRDQLEVIGNVHENPEMLGGDENKTD
ncbi:MAG: YopX family protein, partial [Ruminococcus sp.]|nr:YopX family protein [Ruminococcus sp.]